jgi:hypothetical protein
MTMNALKIFAVAASLAIMPAVAFAHSEKTGPNGGPQTDAGSFHVEIVPTGAVLQVYLRDHADKAVSSEGFKGTAIFVINGKSERITLTPVGDNQLKGNASVTLPAEPHGAVQIVPPKGNSVQATFH